MRHAAAVVGMLIGLGGALSITVSQAETRLVHGRQLLVVPSVTRHRHHVHDMPLVKRCLWVGIPAGLVGAGIGYLAPGGVHLGAAFLGGLVASALSSGWRQNWAQQFGQAGENAQVSDMFLHALVGGLAGAALATYLCHEEDSSSVQQQPPEPAQLS